MSALKTFRVLLSTVSLLVSHSLFAQVETPATVPASFAGTYETIFDLSLSGSPFAHGEKITFVIGNDNSLCVNGNLLRDPVFLDGDENRASWKDPSNSLNFMLLELSNGGFQQIYVLGPSFKPFYGRVAGTKVSDATTCGSASTTTPVITETINQIFALAESKLPAIFPSGAITLTFEQYVYRFYPSTSVYMAFANDAVFLLGGSFGEAVVNIGSVSTVLASLEALEVDVPATGNTGGSVVLWNLSISGSLNSTFAQNIAFAGINLGSVPAPDLSNTSEVNNEITNTLAGIASGVSSISITVVNNTDTRRTFDVSFGATLAGLGAVTYNLRYDYTR